MRPKAAILKGRDARAELPPRFGLQDAHAEEDLRIRPTPTPRPRPRALIRLISTCRRIPQFIVVSPHRALIRLSSDFHLDMSCANGVEMTDEPPKGLCDRISDSLEFRFLLYTSSIRLVLSSGPPQPLWPLHSPPKPRLARAARAWQRPHDMFVSPSVERAVRAPRRVRGSVMRTELFSPPRGLRVFS